MTGGWEVLDRVLAPQPPPFALLLRAGSAGPDHIDILVGELSIPETLANTPGHKPTSGHQVLLLLPYRQLAERGFEHIDDGAPLIALRVTGEATLPVADVLLRLPLCPARLAHQRFDPDDDAYACSVERVITEEIGRGRGANFVIRRSLRADIVDFDVRHALTIFQRLCQREAGSYWTFLVHTGERTFVGATPERHVSLRSGVAVMNPISGTYRYPATGPTLTGTLRFLDSGKETDELNMVVDEELKMMARICPTGPRVTGPYLHEMRRVSHTGYLIEGRSDRDPRRILHETMFAPTVTGSPIENACRVIRRHESRGRRYYSGVVALISGDERGAPVLDSAIMIRTAEIDSAGHLEVGVGATIVRHSDPAAEAAETRAKAAGLLDALVGSRGPRPEFPAPCPPAEPLRGHPVVRARLADRNTGLSGFWLAGASPRFEQPPELGGLRIVVVDAEDTFTTMIETQVRALGSQVVVARLGEQLPDACDFVIMGPGPGDPGDLDDARIGRLHWMIEHLLATGQPFLAVCLSHQVLSAKLGLDLVRGERPQQGVRRTIDLFGSLERVGFYNTFHARSPHDSFSRVDIGPVDVSRDPLTGEVFALRGKRFASVQFHPESVLTENGPRIFATRIKEALES
ncbi:anthranilate synthase family protein [Actinophytocola sp.]|uniref:anthranilate synthase family protein n=1 Tax=Actinophytocola sp. TaxID=1872138 RepID=UPI002ECFF58D